MNNIGWKKWYIVFNIINDYLIENAEVFMQWKPDGALSRQATNIGTSFGAANVHSRDDYLLSRSWSACLPSIYNKNKLYNRYNLLLCTD